VQNYFFDGIYYSRLKASGNYATQFVLSGMPRYVVETALIFAIVLFILVQSSSGDIESSAATIGVFLSGGLRLTASLLPLQSALLIIKQSIPSAMRAFSFLELPIHELPTEVSNAPREADSRPLTVAIQGVSFYYKGADRRSLSEIEIDIAPGLQAAFIGPSGAGKSTLADLILGLLEPSQGRILIDGYEPKTLSQIHQGLLGYVPQKPGMISGTISENIALGQKKVDIDLGRLERAVSNAHLKDLIDSLPLGLDTNIGKRKDELSGGQLQRIGLARALYSEPRLLVMDEATSALDAVSEQEINKALDEMRGKVTVILIAHRLNTVQNSDLVFLLQDGKVTDSGTFPELLRKNETVRKLSKLMTINKGKTS
jgi:ATP-binding cassette subfamily C protein